MWMNAQGRSKTGQVRCAETFATVLTQKPVGVDVGGGDSCSTLFM
jgi:hypothetical protein